MVGSHTPLIRTRLTAYVNPELVLVQVVILLRTCLLFHWLGDPLSQVALYITEYVSDFWQRLPRIFP